jgi:hypothetical protein
MRPHASIERQLPGLNRRREAPIHRASTDWSGSKTWSLPDGGADPVDAGARAILT